MAAAQPLVATINQTDASRRMWNDAWLGLVVGGAGGLLQGSILHSSLLSATLLGAGFGLVFGLVFSQTSIERRRRTDLGNEQCSPVLVSNTGCRNIEIGTHDSNGMLD